MRMIAHKNGKFNLKILFQREIASAEGYTGSSWSKYNSQRSEIFHLTQGQAYYFEVLQNDYVAEHWVNLGLHKHTTTLNHDRVPMAVDEVQELKLSSGRDDEEQVKLNKLCLY